MKGPTLVYDLRVLRVFRCAACGREVPMPGSTTSLLCTCSDPPKFMIAVDRPKTPIPDTTAFQSPADPADLEEPVDEVSDENYVPFIPQIPVRPPQFPQRRKLSEDIQQFEFRENGDQLEVQPLNPQLPIGGNGSGNDGSSSGQRDSHRRGQHRGQHSGRSDNRPPANQNRGRHEGHRRQRDDGPIGRGENRGANPNSNPEDVSTGQEQQTSVPSGENGGRGRDRNRHSNRDRQSDRNTERHSDRHRDRRPGDQRREDLSSENTDQNLVLPEGEASAREPSAERPAQRADNRRGRDQQRSAGRRGPSGQSEEFGDGLNDEQLNGAGIVDESLPESESETDDGPEGDDGDEPNEAGGGAPRRRPRRRGRRRGRGRGPSSSENAQPG